MENPWLFQAKPAPEAPYQLLCLPHSGAQGTIYRPWALSLYPDIEVLGVQLPGRGALWREEPVREPQVLLDALVGAIQDCVDRPFLLYGHSFGAHCAFELCCELRRRGEALPMLLALSGRSAPQSPAPPIPSHDLPRDAMIAELRRLGGTPPEVFRHVELMDSLLPAIRTDFRLMSHWQPSDGPPLDCPIVVFRGSDDPALPHAGAEGWRHWTRAEFELMTLSGGHFFTSDATEKILDFFRNCVSAVPNPAQ